MRLTVIIGNDELVPLERPNLKGINPMPTKRKAQKYKPADSTTTLYLFRDIPRELWTRAHAKAAKLRPPMPIRRILLALVEDWVDRPDGAGVKRPDHSQPIF